MFGQGNHPFAMAGVAALLLTIAAASPAFAGPPFLTDDPEPVEPGHWEAYLFGTLDSARDLRSVEGPAFEVNFGAAPDTQLHLVVPLTSAGPSGGGAAHGLGDVEVGVKYRFVAEGEGRPQVGVFPMIELPTGDASRQLGNGRLWARLPLWVQKRWGAWTTYGGAGYAVNRATGARSYAFGGWLVQRDLGGGLALGGEVYARGADTEGGQGATILNAGGTLDIRPGFSLLFSAGHTIAGERHGVVYLGLYWTWGGSEAAAALRPAPPGEGALPRAERSR